MSEEMNVERVVKLLGTALSLQVRSSLQYMLFSASMSGFEVEAVAAKLWEFARAELEDTRKLVEKVTALGGDPSIDEAPLRWAKTPEMAIDLLIEIETQTVEALHEVIPETGQEGRSEALELCWSTSSCASRTRSTFSTEFVESLESREPPGR